MNWITPYHLSAEERPHIRALHMALVGELYARARVPVLILTASLALLFPIIRAGAHRVPSLKGLFLGLTVVLLFRAGLSLQGDRLMSRNRRLFPRFVLFAGGVLAMGLLLGAMILVGFRHLESGPFLQLCLFVLGITSVSSVSLAGSPLCFAALAAPTLGSLVLGGLLYPPFGLGPLFSLTVMAFSAALLYMSSYVHLSLCRNVLLAQRLGDLALRDALTGLRNRRYLQEFMQEETPRVLRRWLESDNVVRTKRSMSLIMVDLDFFKQVNDVHGHAAGDAILVQVARLLRDVVRKPDLVLRWGGEEFLILALDSDRAAPPLIGVRVHERIAQHEFVLPGGQPYRLTCSVGFAIYPFHPQRPDGLVWEQVFRLADESLYHAKEGGRNRIHGTLPGEADPDQVIAALNEPEPDFVAARAADFIRLL